MALVLLGERYHEPQVRVHHALLGLEVASLDALGELDLLLGAQQRVAADVAEEQLERVAGHRRELAVAVARRRVGLAAAVVGHVDAAGLEPVGQRLGLLV